MKSQLLQDCIAIHDVLEERLDMQIGRLHPSSEGEWVVYDPVAKSLSNQFGQITVDGVGKVNASKPRRRGEFEWFDPRDCADYMAQSAIGYASTYILYLKNRSRIRCNAVLVKCPFEPNGSAVFTIDEMGVAGFTD
jgi:hypothetical protein